MQERNVLGITIKIINIVKAIFLTLAFTVFYLFLLHGSNESFKLIGIQSQSQFSYLLLAYLCIFSIAIAYNNKIGVLNAKFDTLYYLSKERYHDFYFSMLGVFSYVFVGTVLATFVVMQIEPIANQEISSSSMIQSSIDRLILLLAGPISEEVYFRGIVYNLSEKICKSKLLTYLISIASFLLVHDQVKAFIVLLPLAIGCTYLRDKYNTIYLSMLLHIAFNII